LKGDKKERIVPERSIYLIGFFPNNEARGPHMELGSYFGMIIDIMIVLTFFVLVLAFLYMVYSKEEKPE